MQAANYLAKSMTANCQHHLSGLWFSEPVAWEGIWPSDDESPSTSPRLRLSSSRKGKPPAAEPLSPRRIAQISGHSIPQIQEIVNTLSKKAGSALGATWLDKLSQSLAEGNAHHQQQQPLLPPHSGRFQLLLLPFHSKYSRLALQANMW